MKNFDSHISSKNQDWEKVAKSQLSEQGVVVIRDLISFSDLEKINEKVDNILKQPSLLGNIGYYQKDPYKKLYDGFLIHEKIIDIFLNEKIIRIIENYLKDEILINEIFLKNDLGSNTKYFPYHRHTGADLIKIPNHPFGCGMALYLHDTESGAFCYSIESHKTKSTEETREIFSIYEHPESKNLIKKLSRINGKQGDIILFDEKGFHGPEQPTKTPRKIILSGFQLKKYTNNKTRTEIPVLISNLSGLSDKQKDVIGINSGSRGTFESYHLRNLNNNLVIDHFSKLISKKYNYIDKKTNFINRIKNKFENIF
ncbi:MAG: hypothetical protein CMF96_02360 [Candidatus Marinimicrobia bacterium]|nr:hypothetical protein [Candidatus Neomarinimicrobiota bacterium]|tara:strand:- start:440 stop:1378 length:939 start_codon:yes stop_codon:yes gene_type:complete